jgi:hypothetical protein
MARRASDTYTTIEESAVAELSALLDSHIKLRTCPLLLEVEAWRAACCGLPRIAHLVAGRSGFKIDCVGDYYERPANVPLGQDERVVDLSPIRARMEQIIHALDPAGVLWTMARA